jgi:hypothetical protein
LKRFNFCLVVSMIIVVGLAVPVYAGPSPSFCNEFGISDMPEPPAYDDWARGYVMQYAKFNTDVYPRCHLEYSVYYIDKPEEVYVGKNGTMDCIVINNQRIKVYSCEVKWDSVLDRFYFTAWKAGRDPYDGSVNTSLFINVNSNNNPDATYQVIYHSMDLETADGNPYAPANPIPPPPLIGAVQLETVTETVGGVAKIIIPVGLVLLSMLLLMVLIRYLLRSLLLRTRS